MNGIQDWIGEVSIPILIAALAGLTMKGLFGRKSSAKRTAWGFATIVAISALATLPWWPTPRLMSSETLTPIVVARSKVVAATFAKVATPISAGQEGISVSVLDILSGAYLLVAGLLLGRLVLGWLVAFSVRRKALPFREHAGYPILLAEGVSIPFAMEGVRPCIVVPASAREWPEERLHAVLEHEASHLRRRDGLWLLLSNILCSIQWFNPFVWLVDRSLRKDLEFLSDDEVVLKGAEPAAYAQSMLDLASGGRQVKTALAIPFVKKAGIKQRISAVVDTRRHRESITRRGLVGTCLAALSCAALGGGLVTQLQERVANPTSWASDVKEGLTVPGTESNDFVGVFKDGRKAQIVQLTMRTPNGLQSWKPNGERIPQKHAIPVRSFDGLPENMRIIVLRAEMTPTSTDTFMSLGSGSRIGSGEPSQLLFAGGDMIPNREGRYAYAVCYVGVPKEDGYQTSFTFSLTDAPWRREIKVDPRKRFSGNAGSVENLKVATLTKINQRVFGSLERSAGPFQMVTWISKAGREQDDIQITADVLKGSTLVKQPLEGNYGGYEGQVMQNRYYVSGLLDNIHAITISSRGHLSVEMLHVRLKPN